MEHTFRNPDKVQQLPFRDYIREKCPGASQGLSVLDLDLVILLFGKMVDRPRNDDGKFMLVEIKNKGYRINYAQNRLYELMHKLLRKSDPEREHYIGCYLLNWDYEKNIPVKINGIPCPEALFRAWITGKMIYKSLYDED